MTEPRSRTRFMVEPIKHSGVRPLGRKKTRSVQCISGKVNFTDWVDGTVYTFTPPEKFRAAIVTKDQINPGPPYRSGGNFYSASYKREYEPSAVLGYNTYTGFTFSSCSGKGEPTKRYIGGFKPPSGAMFQWGDPKPLIESTSPYNPDLLLWGEKAFKRLKPKLEKASGFVFTAELRDLPHMLQASSKFFSDFFGTLLNDPKYSIIKSSLRRKRNMVPKEVADHFLNVQFGWLPFLSDISKFIKTFENYAAILDKLIEENGKPIRRRVTLEETTSSNLINSGEGYPTHLADIDPNFGSFWFSSVPKWELREEVKTTTWATGAFTYYLPVLDRELKSFRSHMNALRRALLVFGFRVNPIHVYQSLPWTWLFDWITNFGDLLSAWNSYVEDSVVCKYLYVMQDQEIRRTFVQQLPFYSGAVSLSWSEVQRIKRRQEAGSPFGFSLSVTDLTARQISILVALGLSRRWLGG